MGKSTLGAPSHVLRASPASDTKKERALMTVIERIDRRHQYGFVSLDEPTFELLELAKRIHYARTEGEFQDAFMALSNFKK